MKGCPLTRTNRLQASAYSGENMKVTRHGHLSLIGASLLAMHAGQRASAQTKNRWQASAYKKGTRSGPAVDDAALKR